MNRYIVNRWCSVLSCGVVAALFWIVLHNLAAPVWKYASGALASVPTPWLLPVIGVILLGVCWPAGHTRWWAFFGLRHPLRYPPIWVAVIVAFLTLALPSWFDGTFENRLLELQQQSKWWMQHTHWLGMLVLYPILHCLIIANAVAYCEGWKKKRSALQTPRSLETYENLREWVRDDKPIEHPSEDAFGHSKFANKIVRRLIQAVQANEPPPSTTILGHRGTGKSSLLSLVQHQICEQPDIRIVDLSLWPYDTPEAAVAGILDRLREEMGRENNVLELARVQNAYINAVAKVTGWWAAIGHLLTTDGDPECIVKRFDKIAVASGVHYIVWIEDIERYTNEDMLTVDENEFQKRQVDRLTSVSALLYLIDECKSITIVISTTSLRIRIDREKISRFLERMPSLDHEDVWRKITIIRSNAFDQHSMVDPASADHRKKLRMPDPTLEESEYLVWLWNIDDDRPSIQRSIALLLSTPRTLKIMLRQVIDAWDVLKGEIDFDDLLVASTIRAAEPGIFAHIEDNIHRIQSGYQNRNMSAQNPSPDYGGEKLKRLLEQVSDPRRKAAIRSCIEYLFPRVFGEYSHDMWVERSRENPQGLWNESYWNQFINLDLSDQDMRDQLILKLIKDWKNEA
ncbi:MAG: hypothetical protein JJ916_13095 [Phycisphaerales bacterium]|nr:hypothetical protein [Phycisphaerales bacterium]